jgi:hypothetical protein
LAIFYQHAAQADEKLGMIYLLGTAFYTGRTGAAVPQALLLIGNFLTLRVEGIVY